MLQLIFLSAIWSRDINAFVYLKRCELTLLLIKLIDNYISSVQFHGTPALCIIKQRVRKESRNSEESGAAVPESAPRPQRFNSCKVTQRKLSVFFKYRCVNVRS